MAFAACVEKCCVHGYSGKQKYRVSIFYDDIVISIVDIVNPSEQVLDKKDNSV